MRGDCGDGGGVGRGAGPEHTGSHGLWESFEHYLQSNEMLVNDFKWSSVQGVNDKTGVFAALLWLLCGE